MSDELQFEKAEFTEAAPAAAGACALCGASIASTYFEINGQVACPACRAAIEAHADPSGGGGRVVRATAWGLLAGIAGALLWYAVTAVTGYQLGLIAIVVGVLVGLGVRRGAERRGGWLYQAIAMVITYVAIVSTYVPALVRALRESSEPGADSLAGLLVMTVIAFLFALVAPFIGGFDAVMGVLIIGIGLYEAWKINRRPTFEITGPHRVAPPVAPSAVE